MPTAGELALIKALAQKMYESTGIAFSEEYIREANGKWICDLEIANFTAEEKGKIRQFLVAAGFKKDEQIVYLPSDANLVAAQQKYQDVEKFKEIMGFDLVLGYRGVSSNARLRADVPGSNEVYTNLLREYFPSLPKADAGVYHTIHFQDQQRLTFLMSDIPTTAAMEQMTPESKAAILAMNLNCGFPIQVPEELVNLVLVFAKEESYTDSITAVLDQYPDRIGLIKDLGEAKLINIFINAVKNGHTTLANAILKSEQLMGVIGKAINQKDSNGKTALYYASLVADDGLVKKLKAAGAIDDSVNWDLQFKNPKDLENFNLCLIRSGISYQEAAKPDEPGAKIENSCNIRLNIADMDKPIRLSVVGIVSAEKKAIFDALANIPGALAIDYNEGFPELIICLTQEAKEKWQEELRIRTAANIKAAAKDAGGAYASFGPIVAQEPSFEAVIEPTIEMSSFPLPRETNLAVRSLFAPLEEDIVTKQRQSGKKFTIDRGALINGPNGQQNLTVLLAGLEANGVAVKWTSKMHDARYASIGGSDEIEIYADPNVPLSISLKGKSAAEKNAFKIAMSKSHDVELEGDQLVLYPKRTASINFQHLFDANQAHLYDKVLMAFETSKTPYQIDFGYKIALDDGLVKNNKTIELKIEDDQLICKFTDAAGIIQEAVLGADFAAIKRQVEAGKLNLTPREMHQIFQSIGINTGKTITYEARAKNLSLLINQAEAEVLTRIMKAAGHEVTYEAGVNNANGSFSFKSAKPYESHEFKLKNVASIDVTTWSSDDIINFTTDLRKSGVTYNSYMGKIILTNNTVDQPLIFALNHLAGARRTEVFNALNKESMDGGCARKENGEESQLTFYPSAAVRTEHERKLSPISADITPVSIMSLSRGLVNASFLPMRTARLSPSPFVSFSPNLFPAIQVKPQVIVESAYNQILAYYAKNQAEALDSVKQVQASEIIASLNRNPNKYICLLGMPPQLLRRIYEQLPVREQSIFAGMDIAKLAIDKLKNCAATIAADKQNIEDFLTYARVPDLIKKILEADQHDGGQILDNSGKKLWEILGPEVLALKIDNAAKVRFVSSLELADIKALDAKKSGRLLILLNELKDCNIDGDLFNEIIDKASSIDRKMFFENCGAHLMKHVLANGKLLKTLDLTQKTALANSFLSFDKDIANGFLAKFSAEVIADILVQASPVKIRHIKAEFINDLAPEVIAVITNNNYFANGLNNEAKLALVNKIIADPAVLGKVVTADFIARLTDANKALLAEKFLNNINQPGLNNSVLLEQVKANVVVDLLLRVADPIIISQEQIKGLSQEVRDSLIIKQNIDGQDLLHYNLAILPKGLKSEVKIRPIQEVMMKFHLDEKAPKKEDIPVVVEQQELVENKKNGLLSSKEIDFMVGNKVFATILMNQAEQFLKDRDSIIDRVFSNETWQENKKLYERFQQLDQNEKDPKPIRIKFIKDFIANNPDQVMKIFKDINSEITQALRSGKDIKHMTTDTKSKANPKQKTVKEIKDNHVR